jgi:hypothetical protein
MLEQVSVSTFGTTQPFVPVSSAPRSFEARIAARLEKAVSRPPTSTPSQSYGQKADPSRRSSESRSLKPSIDLLSEIIPRNVAEAASETLAKIVTTIHDTLGLYATNVRELSRIYLNRMHWSALLPIYTSLDSTQLPQKIEESHQLALEARMIHALDLALEKELFELLAGESWKKHDPKTALKSTLDICIYDIVAKSQLAEYGHLPSDRHQNSLSDTIRQSYWQLATQLDESSTHLHLPANLVIGKVSWSRIREHWNQFNFSLMNAKSSNPCTARLDNERPIATSHKGPACQANVEPAPVTAAEDGCIEIRSSSDPKLADTLGIQLETCRDEGRSMTLAVFQRLGDDGKATSATTNGFESWHHSLIQLVSKSAIGGTSRGFFTHTGELALVFEDLERGEATQAMRTFIECVVTAEQPSNKYVETTKIGIVCGLACVETPSKRFKIEQLIEASWRCLSAAKNQGAGSVKSIEAY